MHRQSNPAILIQSRGALIALCLLVFIASVVCLCGGNSLACFAVITSDGIVALAWLAGASALGAVVLWLMNLQCNRLLFTAASGGLGLGLFSLLGLGLGLLGWLNRPVAICFPAVAIVLFLIALLRRHPGRIDWLGIETWLREPAGAAWLWLIPVVSFAVATVSAAMMPGVLWKPLDPHPYDVTSYHLLVPREWYEGGRIVPLAHNVFSYFPFNVEMQFLLLMHAMGGPWAAMYTCQFVCCGYAGLMVLAVAGAAVGRRDEDRTSNVERRTSKLENSLLQSSTFDVRRSTFAFSSFIAAAVISSVPWIIMLAGVAYVESGLMLYTALSIALAINAIRDPKHLIQNLILSGIMAGFAAGVKITAVPMLLLALPVAVMIAFATQRTLYKRALQGCIALFLAGSIVLSPWLIRNFIWTGNPLFPLAMNVLGKDHFTAVQVQRFSMAHSPTAAEHTVAGKCAALRDGVLLHWQYGFIFLPVALIAMAIRLRDPQTRLLLICGLFVFITWIGFTHLLPRFLVMLIPIGGIAIAQLRWGRAWPAAILLALIAAGMGWSPVIPELYKQSNPPPFNGQPRPALFGFDPAGIMSQELINARDAHLQIGLVGDAQAFLYQVPMSHLHYRTVFDLQDGDPVDAWIGPQARGGPNWFLVINPMEIDRLHRTYIGVPAVPLEWAEHEPEAFYLRGDEIGPRAN